MNFLSLVLIASILFIKGCSSDIKASEPTRIECEFLNTWEFKRCENKEVICYTNDTGLSCKWK